MWGSKIQISPPTITYEEATSEDERGLFKWLSNVVSLPRMYRFCPHDTL